MPSSMKNVPASILYLGYLSAAVLMAAVPACNDRRRR